MDVVGLSIMLMPIPLSNMAENEVAFTQEVFALAEKRGFVYETCKSINGVVLFVFIASKDHDA